VELFAENLPEWFDTDQFRYWAKKNDVKLSYSSGEEPRVKHRVPDSFVKGSPRRVG